LQRVALLVLVALFVEVPVEGGGGVRVSGLDPVLLADGQAADVGLPGNLEIPGLLIGESDREAGVVADRVVLIGSMPSQPIFLARSIRAQISSANFGQAGERMSSQRSPDQPVELPLTEAGKSDASGR